MSDNGYDQLADDQALIDTAQEAVTPIELDPSAIFHRTVPAGAKGEIIDLEKYADTPRRMRGTVHPGTLEAFIDYVEVYKAIDELTTTVWVHPQTGIVVAVIDDHGDVPGHGDHRAQLNLIPTEEWARWTALDGKLVSLETFAEHIEQSVPEIQEPDGATMLELAQSFSVATSASFTEAKRLHSGEVTAKFTEEHKAAAGQKGEIEIPKEFVLGLKPFLGTDPYKVTARFRYRLRGGDLQVGYQLVRPDEIIREVLDDVAEGLHAKFDHVYIGTPRS